MTHQRAVSLLALLLTSAAHAQAPADPLTQFAWLKDLAGHCWSGTYPDGKVSDTQCYSVQFDRLLRGTIKVTGTVGNQPINFEGDSVYAWNAKANRVQYTLWARDGSYGTGEMYAEGEYLIFPPVATADSRHEMRAVWARIDADSFMVTREQRQDGVWTKILEVTYRRTEAKPSECR
jgi:hypothetical protein